MAGYKEIILAAWLHDIGKFAQRAGIECTNELEGQLCRLQEGGWYSHQHVLYTERFLQTSKDYLPDDVQVTEVIRLASAHHNPSLYDEWLISQGDRLSSGSDRCSHLEIKSQDDETPAKFYEKPLIHLVSSLHIKGKEKPVITYSPLQQMEVKAIFSADNKKVSKHEYLKLWLEFEKDFRALQGLKYSDFIISLDTLMERYCWCIPSTTIQDADISLYQHSKTTAAFAGTLYLFHKEKYSETETALNDNDEQKFLFVHGDISGIQKYIFDLKTTSDNAKLLRARSFQIWTLGVIIAEYLAGQFGVSRENIITSAGGKFLLLVPNTQTVTKKLTELRFELEKYFLAEFAGKLAFILSDGVSASIFDVQQDNMSKLLNAIGINGDEAKQKKMQAVLGKCDHVLDELYDGLQKYGECGWCETLPADFEKDDKFICNNCNSLIDVGRMLIKAEKILFKTEKLSGFNEMVLIKPKDNGQFGYLIEYQAGFPQMPLPYWAPVNENNKNGLLTFDEIANKSTGNSKLAMFKADIDNLGLVFTSSWGGDKENRKSFSRYAQLSRHLHYFFSAYVSNYIKDHQEYRNTIYTVFSGGDDLCILGAWDSVMRFAINFKNEFSAFTNNNPSVTLSGGIALAGSRLPVRAIASEAEVALDKAKNRREKSELVKNGISVFGVTVSWNEYEQCLKDADAILQYMKDGKVSSGVIYKMIDFANRAKEVKKGNLRDLLWMSNYRYVIARNIDSKYKEAIDFFNKFGVSPDVMEKSRIAVSYALYINRKGKEE